MLPYIFYTCFGRTFLYTFLNAAVAIVEVLWDPLMDSEKFFGRSINALELLKYIFFMEITCVVVPYAWPSQCNQSKYLINKDKQR